MSGPRATRRRASRRLAAGTYTVTVTAPCGTDASDPLTVTVAGAPNAPTGTGATICEGNSANLSVSGAGADFKWYDAPGGNFLRSRRYL